MGSNRTTRSPTPSRGAECRFRLQAMRVLAGRSRLLIVATLVSACASVGGVRGEAGPVRWEVVEMRRSTPDSQTVRWDFVVLLRETAGETVTFEKVVSRLVPSSAHPDAVRGEAREAPFERVLGPHSELRVDVWQTLTFGPAVVTGPGAMRGATATRWEFIGRDGAARPVRVDVVVTFTP